ncbi:hypothetical protein TNCV_4935421 [Trichonephila clavipes]|nr:hypothetical protein TNCV_4935421 [Trichonephila clavipes]
MLNDIPLQWMFRWGLSYLFSSTSTRSSFFYKLNIDSSENVLNVVCWYRNHVVDIDSGVFKGIPVSTHLLTDIPRACCCERFSYRSMHPLMLEGVNEHYVAWQMGLNE